MDPVAERLLAWFDHYGRRDLPWQHPRTPYRVWIAEVMLQQTQVATVVPYFERFTARFPNVPSLAAADLDEVLHYWSGLGYYARARNLHAAAQAMLADHAERVPDSFDALTALPGIGRSTAGAILAQAFDQRHPILDGNVKRVLARWHGIEGWPGTAAVEQRLWQLAELHTPRVRLADYTQAIMDLGATVCTRSRPKCGDCPLRAGCAAHGQGTPERYPGRRPRRALPLRQTLFLIVRDGTGNVLLEQRPPAGIWGGLWGFPECAVGTDVQAWCLARFGRRAYAIERWRPVKQVFTHFQLEITPVALRVEDAGERVMEQPRYLWYNGQSQPLGLAAPVKQLLEKIANDVENQV